MTREREPKGKRKAAVGPKPEPASVRGVTKAPLAPRSIARRRTDTEDPSAPIEKGSQVRALGGAFEGKTGVVQELDGRGGARVMFGLLTTRVEVKDLVVMSPGRGRPVLGSSHRKPQPQS
jgi:transcription antitermination factor NusG